MEIPLFVLIPLAILLGLGIAAFILVCIATHSLGTAIQRIWVG